MGKAAVIFPGQGAQSVGMGQDIAQQSQRARDTYARAGQVLGFDIAKLCFEGPAEELERTDIQQPAIFVTSVAIWNAFFEAGGTRDQFSYAAGLSLGEYTALHVAGAMPFEDALELVQCRGQLMQAAAKAQPSGMVSLVGLDEERVMTLCDQARGADVLAPANFNCKGQIVISGSQAACDRAANLADEFECRAISLKVAGAFHSPLMQPAADGLAEVFARTALAKPAFPVTSNVTGSYHTDPPAIRDSLCKQVTNPVLWQRCIEKLIGDGVTDFVEFGPGRVLTGLMRRIDRTVSTTNISTVDSLAAAAPA